VPATSSPHPLPDKLKVLGGHAAPTEQECPSLYDYLCGLQPASAREIFDWCTAPQRNLHDVLPTIQQQCKELLLVVTVPAVGNEHEELLKYAALHPTLRVMLDVRASQLQDAHVNEVIGALKLPAVKALRIQADGQGSDDAVVFKQMDAIGAFLKSNPVHALEDVWLDFSPELQIKGDWPLSVFSHLGVNAHRLWMRDVASCVGAVWAQMLTELSKAAKQPAQLTVLGADLEMALFFVGASEVAGKSVLSGDIALHAHSWIGEGAPLQDLVRLTTGALTISGNLCERQALANMTGADALHKVSAFYIDGELPSSTSADDAALAYRLQEQFNQKVTDARAQQLAAAGLDDVMATVKNDIQRQDVLSSLIHYPPDDAKQMAHSLNLDGAKAGTARFRRSRLNDPPS
jgi:hypothetical protein